MGALGNIPLQLYVGWGSGISPRKKGCKWCILTHFSPLPVHFLFHCFLKNVIVCHKSAGVEGTRNDFFLQRGDSATQFFFSWSEGSGYRPWNFYAPAWKVHRGHLVFGSSVRPSVCLSVRNSVPLINKVQHLKFGWSYSNQTWTVSSSKGCSYFTDITCPWGGAGWKCRTWRFLPYFDFVAAGGIRVSQKIFRHRNQMLFETFFSW